MHAVAMVVNGHAINAQTLREILPVVGYERVAFNDFLGAMTGNKIGYGHSDEYYRSQPCGASVEMFANYTCLIASKGGKVYKSLMHSVTLKVCAEFDAILADKATNRVGIEEQAANAVSAALAGQTRKM